VLLTIFLGGITMKTFMANPNSVEKKWYVIDAEGQTLGRLATEVANLLRGKRKPEYTPFVDTGDYVIVINAEKVALTGNRKLLQLKYFHHTGFPGGIKEINAKDTLSGKHPERVIQKAVERMLPKTKLGRQMIKKLFVYAGSEHKHMAQNPVNLDIAGMNSKNKRGL